MTQLNLDDYHSSTASPFGSYTQPHNQCIAGACWFHLTLLLHWGKSIVVASFKKWKAKKSKLEYTTGCGLNLSSECNVPVVTQLLSKPVDFQAILLDGNN